MDPLSLAAGIIAIVGAASQTLKALRSLHSLRHAPRDILELMNEVSELQALISLVQKAIDRLPRNSLSQEDLDLIGRLIESAQEPLKKLDRLISLCSSSANASSSAESSSRVRVTFSTWLKSKHSVDKIRKQFRRAHQNLGTALSALSITKNTDLKLILNVDDLILDQVRASEEHVSSNSADSGKDLERKFSHALSHIMDKTKAAGVFTEPSNPCSSGQPEVARLESSVSPRSGTLTPRSSEKTVESYQTNTDHPSRLDSYASIQASIIKRTCSWGCPCQCHPRKNIENPRWLTSFLGNLFCDYTGTPLLQPRPCNYIGCQQRTTFSTRLTYHFPQWLIRKTFILTVSYQDLGGLSGSWSIGFPRTISASHDAWMCIERGHPENFLSLLRGKTIFVNDMADDDGTSLLLFALKFRRHEIVELLLDHGANPHLVDPRGSSACAYAQSSLLIDRPSEKPSWAEKMDISLAKMGITDDLCFTPIHHVVVGLEKADIYQQLRLNNAWINAADSLGRSPLHWAVIQGNQSAIEALLAHRASPKSIDKEQMTPLHDICQAPNSSQVRCARLLIYAGADVDAVDAWGRTPLRIAVALPSTNLELVQLLVEKGAAINTRDIYNQTPLLKSIRGNFETTKLLMQHGAETETSDIYGNTPLSESIFRNRPEQLKLLLAYGARTNEPLDLQRGRRAREGVVNILHFTAWYGDIEIMKALEGTEQHFCSSHPPIDDFDQFIEFRLANGLSAGEGERKAFIHLLSTTSYSSEKAQCLDHLKVEESDKEDIFTDAQDYP